MQIQDTEFIKAEVIKILSDFIDSEACEELQNAEILGREIPILLRWDRQIMRGTIDILYKIDNRLIIADYKQIMLNHQTFRQGRRNINIRKKFMLRLSSAALT